METSSILVIYDPFNRPGKFTKSITINYSINKTEKKAFVNIKGLVIPSPKITNNIDNTTENNVVANQTINSLDFENVTSSKE